MLKRNELIDEGLRRYLLLQELNDVRINMASIERAINSDAIGPLLNPNMIAAQLAGLHRSMAGWLISAGLQQVDEPQIHTVMPVSIAPPTDPSLRRSLRVLAMVAELHKAGYQRLRISAGMSASGCDWRCLIVTADNVCINGWEPRSWDDLSAKYTTGDEDRYFGWDDSHGRSAREMAKLFLQRFPELARRGEGPDHSYAGWYVGMLGAAENGLLPVFYADWPIESAQRNMPPPPIGATDANDFFLQR